LLLIGFAAGCGIVFGQAVNGNDSAHVSSQDRKFVMEAAKGGMMEVQMGQLGKERGSSSDVKAYSQRLVDDHTKANEELMTLARQKGITLKPDEHHGMTHSLSSKTGSDFDREFARMAVEDHQKDIAAFEKEASSGSDPDIKAWASKTLPTLNAHLDAAKALAPSRSQ